MKIKACNANEPVWKEISVRSSIPEALKPLDEIAHNMWWSWNTDVSHLFQDIDKDLWKKVGQNPVLFLARMNYAKLEEVAKDASIVKRVNKIYSDFRKYMDVKPDSKRPSVAYLCMEYGLSHVLKIYSGGLGILAGDYLKEASDSNVDMCAVGFLYRYGYFTQTLSMNGDQIANYEAQNFGDLPIERELDQNGQHLVVDVPFNNYTVHAFVWRVNVGRIKLYLLDTDNEMNSEYDRSITHSLYGGDWENRLKQEILLGIGGILTLKKLGIKKDIYHCNEGHAALCNVQRLVDFVEGGLSFDEALEELSHSPDFPVIIEMMTKFANAEKAADKARKEALNRQKKYQDLSKKKIEFIDKLSDAENLGQDSILCVVEGDSAGNAAAAGRDTKKYGILRLRGKMINGLKVDNDDEYYNNKEIELLLYALGINPDKYDPNKLRYGKIAICVDADK